MQSTLKYVAENPEDFGTISCEATNSVGRQSIGCRTTLVSVGECEVMMRGTAAYCLFYVDCYKETDSIYNLIS